MNVTVILLPGKPFKKRLSLQNGSTILDISNKLDINPDTIIPLKAGSPVSMDENLEEGDEIELIRVVSGG